MGSPDAPGVCSPDSFKLGGSRDVWSVLGLCVMSLGAQGTKQFSACPHPAVLLSQYTEGRLSAQGRVFK